MNEYYPDNWVVLKINETLYKVLAGWSGGYLYGDSWRINSGITKVEKVDDTWGFYGETGSVYWCGAGSYRLTMATSGIYTRLKEEYGVELMPENTDWSKLL